jgi:hypothetical protein
MHTFLLLIGVALIAYRVFVKGESMLCKNPNRKMRGLACLVMGLSLTALSAYFLIATYIHHLPILSVIWVLLAAGVFVTVMGVRMMKRLSGSSASV